MEEISLESVDKVIERTGASYLEAKKALEKTNGNVLDAIILIEENAQNTENNETNQTIDEFKDWLKDLIRKGNVSRIKIKKDDEVIVDVPVNAGIAIGVMSIIMPAILAFGVIAAVATKVTIEITKTDGTVEVVNKYVSKATEEVKEKATSFTDAVKNKINEVKGDVATYKKDANDNKENKPKVYTGEESVYSYKVNFDDIDKK